MGSPGNQEQEQELEQQQVASPGRKTESKIDNMQREFWSFAQTKRCNKYKLHGKAQNQTFTHKKGAKRKSRSNPREEDRGGKGKLGAANNGYGRQVNTTGSASNGNEMQQKRMIEAGRGGGKEGEGRGTL